MNKTRSLGRLYSVMPIARFHRRLLSEAHGASRRKKSVVSRFFPGRCRNLEWCGDTGERICALFRGLCPTPSDQRAPVNMHAPTTAADSSNRTTAQSRAIVMGRSWVRPAHNHWRIESACRSGGTSGFARRRILRRSSGKGGRCTERRDIGCCARPIAVGSQFLRPADMAVGWPVSWSGLSEMPVVGCGRRSDSGGAGAARLSHSEERRSGALPIGDRPWRSARRSLAATIAATSAVLNSLRDPSRNSRRMPVLSRFSTCSWLASSCSAASLSVQNLRITVLFIPVSICPDRCHLVPIHSGIADEPPTISSVVCGSDCTESRRTPWHHFPEAGAAPFEPTGSSGLIGLPVGVLRSPVRVHDSLCRAHIGLSETGFNPRALQSITLGIDLDELRAIVSVRRLGGEVDRRSDR